MPEKNWPFLPDRLTDIWNEDLIKFLQSGASVHLKMPTAIVELRKEQDKDKWLHIPTYDRWLNFCDFCLRLRRKNGDAEEAFIGGDESCKNCDAEKTLDFLEGRLRPKPGAKGAAYLCHMKLRDYIAPIEVEGRRVAALFVGQRRPAGEESLAKIRQRVDAVGTPDSDIQASEQAKTSLRALIETIPPDTEGTLERTEQEAETISKFAAERWRLEKEEREDGFLSDLKFPPAENKETLDAGLEQLLKAAAEWCGVASAIAFVGDQPEKHCLGHIVHFGVLGHLLAEPLQFNWSRAGLPLPSAGPYVQRLEGQVLAKGIRGVKGAAFAETVGFSFAAALGTEHRMVLCLGTRKDGLPLENESRFLSRLAGVICQDYLERRQFLDVKVREETWEDVASLIGHQVRNSVNGIAGQGQLAENYALAEKPWVDREEAAEAFRVLQEECTGLAKKATEVLDFWQWSVGRNHRKFEQRPLGDVVQTCVQALEGVAKKEGLEIRRDLPPYELPQIETLGQTLEVAIGNTLENAVKYSFDNRYIVLRVRTSKGWATIDIENFGIGIPEEERERVFEKRYRGKHRGRKNVSQGEGLGAWQAREIITAHGGTITCCSRSGERQPLSADVEYFKTVFTITLPLDQSRRKGGEI